MQLEQDPHSAATVFHPKIRNIISFGLVGSSTNGAFFAVTANGPKMAQNPPEDIFASEWPVLGGVCFLH